MTARTFNEEVLRITSEALESDEVEQMMRAKVVKGFDEAFDSAFRWGDVRKAIETRLRDVLVPAIEGYDMSAYVLKLDEILSQLLEHSAVIENRKILENFRRIVGTPANKDITLEELFEEYCKHVAKDVDTSELEVDLDDEPTYKYVTACAEIEKNEKPYKFGSSYESAMLYLHIEDTEDLSYPIRISRWRDIDDGWHLHYDMEPSIPGLAHMNGFQAYLSALSRSYASLVFDNEYMTYDVLPDARPEANFS